MEAYHIGIRPRGSWLVADTPEARRLVVRCLLDRGAAVNLLAFGIADNHLHIEVVCGRAEAGEFARRVEISLGRRLCLSDGFEPAWIRPVEDATHFRRLFGYVQRQDERHRLLSDPLREGCSLPDLLGLRPRGAYLAANVRRFLPRVRRGDLVELLGFELAADPAPIVADPTQIVEAGLAATLLCDPRKRNAEHLELRRAVVHVAAGLGCSSGEIAGALAISPRGVRHLRGQAELASPRLVEAIGRQIALRRAFANAALSEQGIVEQIPE